MSALQHYPLSLAGQIGMLIPAVAEFERQQTSQHEAQQKALAILRQKLEQANTQREQQKQEKILAWLRNNPGSKTNEIAKYIMHDRSTTFHRLMKLEVCGLVVRSATGKVLKWDATK